jgi:hypothetical protein
MVGWFPDFHYDEMVYSCIASYIIRMGLQQADGIIDLFGNANFACAQIDLPRGLDYFVSNLPTGHTYNIEEIINEHTLYRFFAAFLPRDRSATLFVAMQSEIASSLHSFMGSNSWVAFPMTLRFCPLCIKEEREEVGTCYWSRTHHIPGVEVCTKHSVFLESTDIPTTGKRAAYKFIAAEQAVFDVIPRELDLSNIAHKQLFDLANNAEWLLQNDVYFDLNITRQKYKFLLAERGLATYGGTTRKFKLVEAFKSFYHPTVLKTLNCELDESLHRDWIARLLTYKTIVLSPVYHLLLIQFLGHTPESLLELPDQPKYFGNGPWPCLNAKCDEYLQLCIEDCQLKFSQQDGRPEGIFQCKCGFTYSRLGPDLQGKDMFTYRKVISDGRSLKPKVGDHALLAQHKNTLATLVQNNSAITRYELKRLASAAVNYVSLYDRDWFDKHMPAPKTLGPFLVRHYNL